MGQSKQILKKLWIGAFVSLFLTVSCFSLSLLMHHKMHMQVCKSVEGIRAREISPALGKVSQVFDSLHTLSDEAKKNPGDWGGVLELGKKMGIDLILTSFKGKVLASSHAEFGEEKDLFSPEFANAPLALSINRSFMTLTEDVSQIAFDPEKNRIEVFFSIPLFIEEKLVGVLTAAIKIDLFIEAIQQQLKGEKFLLLAYQNQQEVIVIKPFSDQNFSWQGKVYHVQYLPPVWDQALHAERGGVLEKDVVQTWGFIPRLNWGIVTEKKMATTIDILQIIKGSGCFLFILFLIFLGGICLVIPKKRKKVFHGLRKTIFVARGRPLYLALLSFCLIYFLYLSTGFLQSKSQLFSQIKTDAEVRSDQVAQEMGYELYRTEFIVKSIAYDLYTGKVTEKTLLSRIEKELALHPQISGMIFSIPADKSGLDSPSSFTLVTKEKGEVKLKHIKLLEFGEKIFQNKGGWISPAKVMIEKKGAALYTTQTLVKNTQILYSIGAFINIEDLSERYLNIDFEFINYEYPLLIAKDGMLLYHPDQRYLANKETLSDFADSIESQELKELAQGLVHATRGEKSFYSSQEKRDFWITYTPIVSTQWFFGVVLPKDFMQLPAIKLREYLLKGLITGVVFLLLLTLFIFNPKRSFGMRAHLSSSCAVVIFSIAIYGLWHIAQKSSLQQQSEKDVISKKTELAQFLNLVRNKAIMQNESPPTTIPTGIYIYNLSIDGLLVDFSAYIWQKFDATSKVLQQSKPILPQAIKIVNFSEVYRKKEGEVETVGWFFKGAFPHHFQYSRYPIDINMVNFLIENTAAFGENAILIPDLEGYSEIEVKKHPEIFKALSIPGFLIEKSFFSLKFSPQDSNFGIGEKNKVAQSTSLYFHIVLRHYIFDFISKTCLPLLIILIGTFCFLVIRKKSSDSSIASYIALIFALILMHTALRNQYQTNGILYAEYLFFSTYFTIAVLMIFDTFFQFKSLTERTAKTVYPHLVNLFWPIQFAIWFLLSIYALFIRS